MEVKEMTMEVKSLILDCIGEISNRTNTTVERICSYWSQGLNREVDYFISLVEDRFVSLTMSDNTHESCKNMSRPQVNMFIRQILFDRFITYTRGGVPPKKETGFRSEKLKYFDEITIAVNKLKAVVIRYEGTSTDWVDKAFKEIRESGDKTMIMLSGWLFTL